MALKYPDILEHNNPNYPLVDVTSLKGIVLDSLIEDKELENQNSNFVGGRYGNFIADKKMSPPIKMAKTGEKWPSKNLGGLHNR